MTRCPPFAMLPACSREAAIGRRRAPPSRPSHLPGKRTKPQTPRPSCSAFLLYFRAMASPKKRSSDVRKFRTRHKYRGKRRRTLPKATAMDDAPDAPISDRPNADTEPRDSGCEIDAAVEFISASLKKIGFFESEPRPVGAPTVNTMLCEIGALTALVAGSACPTCRERKLGVREAAGKRKGLSAFLELCCENSDCPESTFVHAHVEADCGPI
ncbi:hypothetical protein HPB52_015939 [Rhipicephalus sanguineus]|uniref:Uncharacterized protein n=1 Tax=Rhipicephalus sanguineus TaxID=34632 RepID=A0A9D4PWT2_RHISA|nr:hypothetical protein HPB52_015939 [Rhipicephalus sanguineus]